MPNIGWGELIVIAGVLAALRAALAVLRSPRDRRACLPYGGLALGIGYFMYANIAPDWRSTQSWLVQFAEALDPQVRPQVQTVRNWYYLSVGVMGAGGLALLAGLFGRTSSS